VAVVRANYTRKRRKIKATVRYIQHRPGRHGQRLTRTLFGLDGQLTRDAAYQLIDEAPKGTRFFHLKISPDPSREDGEKDLDLRGITEQTLPALSERLGRAVAFIGAIHDDHAPHRHMHVIAMVQRNLTRSHFKLMRETATAAARTQRQERDLIRGVGQQQKRNRAQGRFRTPFVPGPGKPKQPKRCHVCGVENCLLHENELELDLTH
jgi:hypothetical protein